MGFLKFEMNVQGGRPSRSRKLWIISLGERQEEIYP